jgi:hypothetical protein
MRLRSLSQGNPPPGGGDTDETSIHDAAMVLAAIPCSHEGLLQLLYQDPGCRETARCRLIQGREPAAAAMDRGLLRNTGRSAEAAATGACDRSLRSSAM